jgi:hypothetical protein
MPKFVKFCFCILSWNSTLGSSFSVIFMEYFVYTCFLSDLVIFLKVIGNIRWGQDSRGQVDQLCLVLSQWIDPAVLYPFIKCMDISRVFLNPRIVQKYVHEMPGSVSVSYNSKLPQAVPTDSWWFLAEAFRSTRDPVSLLVLSSIVWLTGILAKRLLLLSFTMIPWTYIYCSCTSLEVVNVKAGHLRI